LIQHKNHWKTGFDSNQHLNLINIPAARYVILQTVSKEGEKYASWDTWIGSEGSILMKEGFSNNYTYNMAFQGNLATTITLDHRFMEFSISSKKYPTVSSTTHSFIDS